MKGVITTVILVTLITIGFVLSALVNIEIASVAQGVVAPSGKVRKIQNLEGGIIKEILVREGDVVSEGDALMNLETIISQSEVGEIETRLAFLSAEIALHRALVFREAPNFSPKLKAHADILRAAQKQFSSITNTIRAEEKLFEQRSARLKARLEKGKIELIEKNKELKILAEQIAISEDLLKEKITSELEHLDLKRQKQAISSSIATIEKEQKNSSYLAEENNLERQLKRDEREQKLNEKLQIYIEEESKYLNRLKRFKDQLRRTQVLTPVSGRVKLINVSTLGGVVSPGIDLVEIVPTEENLVIEAKLKIEDIGYVSVGQPVLIRLKGEVGRQFEPLDGYLSMISPDSQENTAGDKPFYPVKITSLSTAFKSDKIEYRLVPGVEVESNIVLGNRTLLEHFLAPFLDIKNRAFREMVWPNAKLQQEWLEHFKGILDTQAWQKNWKYFIDE
jgi:adhesin transport system membrane fusion protein